MGDDCLSDHHHRDLRQSEGSPSRDGGERNFVTSPLQTQEMHFHPVVMIMMIMILSLVIITSLLQTQENPRGHNHDDQGLYIHHLKTYILKARIWTPTIPQNNLKFPQFF